MTHANVLSQPDHVKYVVFGHTHLAKKVELADGKWYFNTGTWADLIQLPENVYEDEAPGLNTFLKALKRNEIDTWRSNQFTYLELAVDTETDKVVSASLQDHRWP